MPEDIGKIYEELRLTVKEGAYTATILMGRKLIMHLAVDVAEAKEGETFISYLDHLQKSGYIPPSGKRWLEYLKDLGNEKNHEIKIGNSDEAEKIIKFVEVLLIFMYEFPNELPESTPKEQDSDETAPGH
ncbi:MAG: DUF4145 domain-containing protein [Candidatus Woesebacteria bacterium]|nr:DUF4145 domain-containing protein [Candidatus Woesebacteria bacterium]